MLSFSGASHPTRDIPAPGSQAAQGKPDTPAGILIAFVFVRIIDCMEK